MVAVVAAAVVVAVLAAVVAVVVVVVVVVVMVVVMVLVVAVATSPRRAYTPLPRLSLALPRLSLELGLSEAVPGRGAGEQGRGAGEAPGPNQARQLQRAQLHSQQPLLHPRVQPQGRIDSQTQAGPPEPQSNRSIYCMLSKYLQFLSGQVPSGTNYGNRFGGAYHCDSFPT